MSTQTMKNLLTGMTVAAGVFAATPSFAAKAPQSCVAPALAIPSTFETRLAGIEKKMSEAKCFVCQPCQPVFHKKCKGFKRKHKKVIIVEAPVEYPPLILSNPPVSYGYDSQIILPGFAGGASAKAAAATVVVAPSGGTNVDIKVGPINVIAPTNVGVYAPTNVASDVYAPTTASTIVKNTTNALTGVSAPTNVSALTTTGGSNVVTNAEAPTSVQSTSVAPTNVSNLTSASTDVSAPTRTFSQASAPTSVRANIRGHSR